jgi:hypothetical protein
MSPILLLILAVVGVIVLGGLIWLLVLWIRTPRTIQKQPLSGRGMVWIQKQGTPTKEDKQRLDKQEADEWEERRQRAIKSMSRDIFSED